MKDNSSLWFNRCSFKYKYAVKFMNEAGNGLKIEYESDNFQEDIDFSFFIVYHSPVLYMRLKKCYVYYY